MGGGTLGALLGLGGARDPPGRGDVGIVWLGESGRSEGETRPEVAREAS